MQQLPMYLPPSEVQSKIGISTKTLLELKDSVFKRGVHYFIPTGKKYALWKTEALIKWIEGDDCSEEDELVADILNIA